MPHSPDLVLLSDTIHTMDRATEGITAIGVTAGRISHLGTRHDASSWSTPGTEVHDFFDACINPGFIDSHIHPVMGAEMTDGVDLREVRSLAEATALLRNHARRTPEGTWIRGWGLEPSIFGLETPNGQFLDLASGNHPMIVRLFDGHSLVANSIAMRFAGIDGARPLPVESGIECDERGRPTGWLVEMAAMEALLETMPPEPLPYRVERLRRLLDTLAQHGLTGGQVMDFNADSSELLTALELEGDLPLQLRCALWCQPGTTPAHWDRLAGQIGSGGRRWSVTGIKFFIDGTIDNGTAWLSAPDTLGKSGNPFWAEPAQFSEALRFFAERSIPTATHAIGDAGVDHVLQTLTGLPADLRSIHRIEHLETLPDRLVRDMARLGIAASMQPTHCTHFVRPDRLDNWSTRLGHSRANQGWRCRDLRDAGVTVALGSDWPIAPFDPLTVMADAQLRARTGRGGTPINPEQSLTARMALQGYTTHAAKAAGVADRLGSITIGKQANFTVLAADPLAAAPDDLANILVLATFIEGSAQHLAAGISVRE